MMGLPYSYSGFKNNIVRILKDSTSGIEGLTIIVSAIPKKTALNLNPLHYFGTKATVSYRNAPSIPPSNQINSP